MIQIRKEELVFEEVVDDFERVKDMIGMRIYSADYLTNLGRDLVVGYDVASGLFAMLIFDLPSSVRNIQPSSLTKWNKSSDELFSIAKANIVQNYPLDISSQLIDIGQTWLVSADHFFSPNILFRLDDHPQLIGTHGSLMILPHRHSVAFFPIEDTGVVAAINKFIVLANNMFDKGPGSITNNLYWVQTNGNIMLLPHSINNGELQFTPPKELVDLLTFLAK